MSLIGGILAARRHLFSWFGGLALSAKAGIATAAFVTMSAGVVIGAPYTPSSAPWLTPTVAPYQTLQTPSALQPSVVEAATPTPIAGASVANKTATRPAVATTAPTQEPTSAPATATIGTTDTTAAVAPTSRLATTMAPAATSAASTSTTTSKRTTALQTSASVYYKNCAEASKSGAAPITSGQPGYRSALDPNHNGIACEAK